MKSTGLRHSLFLMIAAAIWGFAFAFQSLGGEMGTFTFNMLRSFIGCAVLLPVIKAVNGSLKPGRTTLAFGIPCGIAVGIACNFQQAGLMYTSPGKAGFITASYMVIVALFSLFSKRKPGTAVLLSIVVGAVGLGLICLPEGEDLSVNRGDMFCMVCALCYAVQIMLIARAGEKVEPIKMCAIQFLIAGAISAVLALMFEKPSFSDVRAGIIPLLYVGILSTGGAYTLQMVGMAGVNPAVASLIMSLESVFSVLGEWIVFGTMLSGRALAGCFIMFFAILLSQADVLRGIRS